uniref:Uncharacterized protein n=1 Tax=Arundo donax TaxID=35708 RepID=A0A0A9ECE0_ARUDO
MHLVCLPLNSFTRCSCSLVLVSFPFLFGSWGSSHLFLYFPLHLFVSVPPQFQFALI